MNTISIVFERFYFDLDQFEFKIDEIEGNPFIPVNGKTSPNEISMLIGSLLSINRAATIDSLVDELQKEDQLALGGGLTFSSHDYTIYPGCCSDFQMDGPGTILNLQQKKGIWMGHNPDILVDYTDNGFKIYSEDNTEKSIYYTFDDFYLIKKNLEADRLQFLDRFLAWQQSTLPHIPGLSVAKGTYFSFHS